MDKESLLVGPLAGGSGEEVSGRIVVEGVLLVVDGSSVGGV